MARPKHPHKEIEDAIHYAESHGWVFQHSGKSSHAWGRILCPEHTRDGHSMSIWSTPRNPGTYAKQIKRAVDKCKHTGDNNE